MSYYEVRYFQPARQAFSDRPPKLDGTFCYPDRWVYAVCWEPLPTSSDPTIKQLSLIGGEGRFNFVDGRCSSFLGEYEAEIVGTVSENQRMRRDRYEVA